MQHQRETKSVWWGSFEFEEDHAGQWRVGPSTLWIYRSHRSWHLVHSETHDPLDEAAAIRPPLPIDQTELSLEHLPPEAVVNRYSFYRTDKICILRPALADRAVVVRPDIPLYILAGEEVTMYVSTPLWMRIEVGAEPRLLREIPSFRPSDTWFGPSTREGELCYSVKTVGRLRLESLPLRLHRAVTPIHVRNRGSDALHIDRIQLPVQYLSLYEGSGNFLWTQSVTLERGVGSDAAAVRFDHGSPEVAGEAALLRGPRHEVRTNMIIRAFSSIFNRLTVED